MGERSRNASRQRSRRSGRDANANGHFRPPRWSRASGLRERRVKRRTYSVANGGKDRIVDNADDRSCFDHAAERISAREELTSERLIDDRDGRGGRGILIAEVTAREEARAVGGKPARPDRIPHTLSLE